MSSAERVASRFTLWANLDAGRGVFTEQLKIHRYSESVVVTDMVNAGKRGKKVRELTVLPGYLKADLLDRVLKQAVTSILHMSYDAAKAKLEKISEDHPGLFTLSENTLRGIDVEPPGTTFNLEKKFPNGEIVRITSSPHEFRVTNSTLIDAANKPAHGFRQDTNYWSRGKESGIVFYTWLKENLSRASNMTLRDLTKTWDSLGIKWDSH
jgi:hypothetical protein